MRKFKILIRPHYGKIGTLVGEVDYLGWHGGWHTLTIENHGKFVFAGDEVEEIFEKEKNSHAREENYPTTPEN
jgi:hypothetical protein